MNPKKSQIIQKSHEELRKELGARLRNVREALAQSLVHETGSAPGIDSQSRWAKVLRVDQTDISRWENGVQLPPITFLIDVQAVTGVSIDYLVTGTICDAMDAELAKALREAHPNEVQTPEQLKKSHQPFRSLALQADESARPTGRPRKTGPARSRKPAVG